MYISWERFDKNYYEKYFKIRQLFLFEIRYLRKRKRTGKLLDIGCGIGNFLFHAEKYYEAYGVDISSFAIKYARRRLRKTTLIVASANNLPFRDNFFDVVTCFDVLEHIRYPKEALREVYRVLKLRSLLMIRVPNIDSIGVKIKGKNWYGFRDKTHISLLSNEEWIKLMEEIGFTIVETFYDGLWDTPYINRIPKVLQDILIKIPSILLFQMGVRFPRRLGENIYITATKE
jgi:ubiquinone/menaquinone biosynthesis C-methylase UbiE